MNSSFPLMAIALVIAFIAGFGTHFLFKRWRVPEEKFSAASLALEPQSHRVTFVPQGEAAAPVKLPLLEARDVEKIRRLTGNPARIRGRVFRVGHSARSNTYFLNFGPSREAVTAVIFASALESFEKRKLAPKGFEGKEIEIEGVVKNHPQYGLEVILESPAQLRIVD